MAGVGSAGRFRLTLALSASALSLPTAVVAAPAAPAATAPAAIDATRPAGFETLMAPQQLVVDLYYHGENIGQTTIWTVPGGLRFDDVDAVIARLPGVADPAAIRAALARPALDPHVALVCEDAAAEAAGNCGRLPPDRTGVVFDQRHFRLDLFVASSLLEVRAATGDRYLSPSTQAPGLVGFVSGTVAGSTGRHDYRDYTVQTRMIAGRGDERLRAEASYGSGYGAAVDTLVAEIDRPGVRYSAGQMWVPGIDLVGRRKLLGVGVRSQLDTRLDREVAIGSPLVVSLLRRSRVDILRDGQLVSSRTYDAGNQTLDTAGLPDGSYLVTLRIQEVGGTAREERRFFSKNNAVPAVGASVFFGYAGVLADVRPGRVFSTTDTPYLQAGGARRIGAHLSVDATAIATNRTLIGEVGGVLLRAQDTVRLAGLFTIHGDAGVIVQANSSGLSRLNYSIDARQVWSSRDRPLLPVDRGLLSQGDRSATLGEVAIGSFAEVSGTLGYRLGLSQLGLSGSYRHLARGERYYAIGPSASVPIVQRRGVQLFLRADATVSNRGRSAFLGLVFTRTGPAVSLTANAGIRSTGGARSDDGTDAVGGIAASWQRDGVLGGNLAVAGGVEREVGTTIARGRADLVTRAASFYADVVQPLAHDQGGSGDTQYSLNAATSFSVGAGRVVLDGRRRDDSMIIVSVDGAPAAAPFDVLVDGSPRGTVRSGKPLAISVPAYRRYTVRVKSTGEALLRVDGSAHQVSVFPGTVAPLRWRAQPVLAMFGRLVWPDGSPVADALITTGTEIAQSDGRGFFQIEAAVDAVVKARAGDGRTCEAPLSGTTLGSYSALGVVTCLPPARPTVIASAGTHR